MKLKNQRGFELAISTLVIIILAIVVVIALVIAFTGGWSNLMSKITSWASPVNVDTIKQACELACTTKSSYDYCCNVKNVKYATGDEKKQTCDTLGGECAEITCNVVNNCQSVVCAEGNVSENKPGCEQEKVDASKYFDNKGELLGAKVCCAIKKK